MKKWLYILLAFLPMLSCVGQKDDPAAEVRLVADFSVLNVTAGDSTTFTVLSGEEDVTEYATIRNETDGTVLEGAVFTPDEEGEWTFVASIDGAESEPVLITALAIAEEGKDYFRRSLLLDFTGTWCVNCPKMEEAIHAAMEARPGRIVPIAVHCKADAMRLKPASDDLVKQFDVKEFPSAVVDLDPESKIVEGSAELLLHQVDRLLDARGPAAGIRVTTSWDKDAPGITDNPALVIEAELTAVRDGDYTLGFAVLEDGIVAAQTGGSPDHVHDNVLRHWKIADSHTPHLTEGETLKLCIMYEVAESQRVVVMAIRNGIVDNVVTCAAGASVDYQYEEEND